MGKFTDKIVVITGGVQPNSLAMAKKFAQEGAKSVIVLCESIENTEALVRDQGAVCQALECNIADFADVTRCFDAIKAQVGFVDILVCNPNAECKKTLLETTPEEYNQVLAINVHSLFYCTKQVYADFKERRTGKLILFSDNDAFGVAGNAAHAITMASALGYIGSCSREGEKYGVTCNLVTPTAGCTPEDVANTVALLTSEEGRPFHGQVIKVIKDWTKG